MDDLSTDSAPQIPAPQFLSRRELRAAEAAAAAASAPIQGPEYIAIPLAASTEANSTEAKSTEAPIAPPALASLRVDTDAIVKPPKRREINPPRTGKLKRTENRLIRASGSKGPRKNPISVLVTMVAVGGMFAVLGLPAYASVSTNTGAVKTEVDPQSVLVSSTVAASTVTRDGYHATTQAELDEMSKDALRAEANAAYNASGAQALGDDYPWPYELMEGDGGGLSPLNYYYRECVDFVAWRLNRDAGSYSAPFKWVWSNLTPLGGNGGQWMYNWQAHGWPVSNIPVVGSVAYTGGNHVAYVKSVNGDGTVTIEEYNYIHGQYGQRTLPATSVVAFLYPPPA